MQIARVPLTVACAIFGLMVLGAGCGDCSAGDPATSSGSSTGQGGSTPSSGPFMGSNGSGNAGDGPCVNLECKQVQCSGGATTTVTGTVYDPSGTLPLYNATVYVPNAPLEPIPEGLSCDQCGASLSGSPIVTALTDTQGRFRLENVPVGDDIPLVIQIGKWRREIVIPAVAECAETVLSDPQETRLPRSSAEGHLPRIALTTGDYDPLFCLLRRIGIADEEFGISGSDARIHFYRGANGSERFDDGFGSSPGATFPNGPSTLWTDGWDNYDIVMLSCEGEEYPGPKNGRRVGLRDYLNLGGRVFATHFHYNWMQGDAPDDLKSVATFSSQPRAFDNDVDIDTSFPKGMALADWLVFVDGSSPHGTFEVVDGRRHTQTVNEELARIWVRRNDDPIYFSFNAPIGADDDKQCGRMVFSDIHVSAGAGDPEGDFPSTCSNNPLTEQEKALIFMLFDLSSCIIPDDKPPCPPGVATCSGPGDLSCNGTCTNQCCYPDPQ